MSRSSTKREPWLSNQINTAKKNLSEWPEWMKDVSQINGNASAPRNGVKAEKATSNTNELGRKRK